jgi:YVTN family beta-propeller protein
MHRGLAAVAVGLIAITACAGPAAAPTAPPATSAVAAATTAAPSRSPTTAPTLLPVIDANTSKIALTKIPIPPIAGKTASIDIIEIDQAAHLMYVTDRTDNGIDVFDVTTPTAKYLKTIDVGVGPNGVTVAKNVNKLFAGLNDSSVVIIDIDPSSAKYQTVIAKLATGGKKRADEMDYDPKDKKLYVADSDDGIVSVIDAVSNTIIKKFENVGDALEQPRYNPGDGMMYMTSSDQNAIFQYDPAKDVLVKKFDVGAKCNPNGLAINPATNQALLGCSARAAPITVVWDLAGGKIVTTFDQTGGGDATFFSAKADRFFFAASNFNRGGVMSIFTANPVKFLTNVPTAVGSHGVAFDETNNIVYTQDQLPNEGALFSFPLPK